MRKLSNARVFIGEDHNIRHAGQTPKQGHAQTVRRTRQKNAWDVVVNRYTNPWISCQKFQHTVQTIVIFRKMISKQLVNWPMYGWLELLPNGKERATKRMARLRRYLEGISDVQQFCHVGNSASECKLGVFQDADSRWKFRRFEVIRRHALFFGDHPLVFFHERARNRPQCHTAAQKLR